MLTDTLPRQNLTLEEFRTAREMQKRFRGILSEIARRIPRHETGRCCFDQAPLLCQQNWIPPAPIRLATPDDDLQDDSPAFKTEASLEAARESVVLGIAFRRSIQQFLPRASPGGEPFSSLRSALLQIEPEGQRSAVSRPSYSLCHIESGGPMALRFKQAEYFDHLNCGELLALEFAHEWQRLDGAGRALSADELSLLDERLLLRHQLGAWSDVSSRPSLAGVSVLTIFWDRLNDAGTFPMMCRDGIVMAAQGTDHVIPAGEFQPTTGGPRPFVEHCTLWQTVLREFAEEILLDDEAKSHGRDMRDLARLPKILPLVNLMRSGKWQCYYLGTALDPLTLKAEILLVSIIDKGSFLDHASDFLEDRRLPVRNTEGALLRGHEGWGEAVTPDNLRAFLRSSRTLPAGRGCIELFIRGQDAMLEQYRDSIA